MSIFNKFLDTEEKYNINYYDSKDDNSGLIALTNNDY